MVDGSPVEVKKASKTTVNQVRAVKYIPLVVYYEPSGTWYVVPAHHVVRLVAPKARGQHNEIVFECSTLRVNQLGEFRVAKEADLLAATRFAIAAATKYPELKQEMERALREARKLARDTQARVQEILAKYKLG